MYRYLECGLANVWLANGYEWVSTPLGKALRIRSADELQKVIARAVIAKPGGLSGEEFRFLRKGLNLSQRALAGMLGNEEQTVALWEKRRGPPLWADRLMRAFHKEETGGAVRLRAIFAGDGDSGPAKPPSTRSPRRVFEKRARGGWHEAPSALAKAA